MMCLAACDMGTLCILYNLTYRAKIGTWETLGNGVNAIPVLWVAVSYLAGRYSNRKSRDESRLDSAFYVTLAVAGVVGLIVITHSWLYAIGDAETRVRSFLIPLLIVMTLVSTGIQQIFENKSKEQVRALVICSQEEREIMKAGLRSTPVDRDCIFLDPSEYYKLSSISWPEDELIIGEYDVAFPGFRDFIIKERSKGRRVIRIADWCESHLHYIPPELVDFEWLTFDIGFALQPGRFGWRVKRLADIVVSAILITLSFPVVVIFCLLIFLEDGGPVFYGQIRTGLYGKHIKVWKLRSMRLGAENDGAVWATKGDKRITSVGRVIRKYRIDELPQLFGVITGELSLIGPRPERPEIETQLESQIPNYRIRHWIKPGLSGWAQVCFNYGASVSDSRAKLSYDLFYLKNAGILMDGLIVIKTIKLLIFGEGSSATGVRTQDEDEIKSLASSKRDVGSTGKW